MDTTRGPLPSRVYWRRRLVLLLLLLSLVVIGLRAFGVGGGTGADDTATGASASTADETGPSGAGEQAGALSAEEKAERKAARQERRAARRAANAPPPEPEGRCADEDVVVSPMVPDAVAGQDVTVVLNLRTLSSPACTWRISPAHLSMKVTSGSDGIWSSQECPGQLDRSRVTVRQDSTSTASLTWNGRRSDEDCPGDTLWAAPGYYHLVASSLGGEPNDVQFRMVDPATLTAAEERAVEQEAAAKRREARAAAVSQAKSEARRADQRKAGAKKAGDQQAGDQQAGAKAPE